MVEFQPVTLKFVWDADFQKWEITSSGDGEVSSPNLSSAQFHFMALDRSDERLGYGFYFMFKAIGASRAAMGAFLLPPAESMLDALRAVFGTYCVLEVILIQRQIQLTSGQWLATLKVAKQSVVEHDLPEFGGLAAFEVECRFAEVAA